MFFMTKPAQLRRVGCVIDEKENGPLVIPVRPHFYPGPDSDFETASEELLARLEALHAEARKRVRGTFIYVRPNGVNRGFQVPVERRDLKMNEGKFLRD